MGQKVHPTGIRLGISKDWNSTWFANKRDYAELLISDIEVRTYLQKRLAQAGDHAAVAILDVILRDEVGHVHIGNRWYAWCCAQQGLDPVAHYAVLTERYQAPRLKPPFNLAARRAAGFSDAELAWLQALPEGAPAPHRKQ